MRILYYHQHFSTPAGATGTRSYEAARRLVARGHEVHVVCGSYRVGVTGLTGEFRRGKRTGTVDGIQVTELKLSYGNADGFLRRSWQFARFALRGAWLAVVGRYDLAFATSTPLTAAVPGIVARWLRRKPFVFEVRDLWPELPRAMGVIRSRLVLGLLSALEWLAYRSATRCIGLSPGICAGIVRRGKREMDVVMIPNGCDRDSFAAIAPGGRPPEVGENDTVAVFAGAHGLANGLGAVLDAAAVLARRGRRDIRILLVGDGMQKAALVERARAEGLTNVLFLPSMAKRELVALMKASQVGLMVLANVPAFYFGTSPNKFFDYLSCGLPVVNNYPGWLAELIAQHDCGIAVEPDRPEAFADALERLADRPQDRARLAGNALRLAAQFDRDLLVGRVIDTIEGAIGLAGATPAPRTA